MCICINECQNLINSFLIVCFNDFKQRVQKETCFEKSWLVTKVMKQKSDRQLNVIFCSSAYFFSKHFVLLIIWWCHIMRPSAVILCALVIPITSLLFEINLLSNLNILRLVLGDWSCSGNIKQVFFNDPTQTLFYKKCRKQMGVYLWNAP